ncbi:SDR family NAD(P)-dependent oxidoreductase [Candidatus Parcubacteria bacterium]|nr:SDR family NAD(P)-dependent oxidoreductase [Candidatus Parcubacteria bacterium]
MKTVVITGASRGIGYATARKFLAEGWFVIGTSTTGNISITNENFLAIKADYLKSKTIKEAVTTIIKLGKNIDILVNNAAIGDDEIGDPLKIDLLRKTLEVNVVGTADFTNQLLPMLNSPSHIINISSMASSLTDPIENTWHIPAYKISKAALNMYTRTMGMQLKNKNIKVSSLDPAWVKTDMGGPDAPGEPEDAAGDIYNLAISNVETGQFWLKGKKRNW